MWFVGQFSPELEPAEEVGVKRELKRVCHRTQQLFCLRGRFKVFRIFRGAERQLGWGCLVSIERYWRNWRFPAGLVEKKQIFLCFGIVGGVICGSKFLILVMSNHSLGVGIGLKQTLSLSPTGSCSQQQYLAKNGTTIAIHWKTLK